MLEWWYIPVSLAQVFANIFFHIFIGNFEEAYLKIYSSYSYLNYLETGYLNESYLCISEVPAAQTHAYLAKKNFREFVKYANIYLSTGNFTYFFMAREYLGRMYSEFSETVSLSVKAYKKNGEHLYSLYRKLDALGAEHSDFPGRLREIYLELSEVLRKIENAKKDENYYLKISKQNDIGTKLVAAGFFLRTGTVSSLVKFYNIISGSDSLTRKVCELVRETDSEISYFKKQLRIKREHLIQEKKWLEDELKNLEDCNLFSDEIVSFVINGSFVSSGEAASPSLLCERSKRLLSTLYIPHNFSGEDYLYREYAYLKDVERKLSDIRSMIEQAREDISRTREVCFTRAETMISQNRDVPIVRKLIRLLKEARYENNFSACYTVLLTLRNYFGTNISRTLFSLKEKISLLSSIGYNVSYCEFLISTAEDFLEYGRSEDAAEILSEAGLCVSKKYSDFLSELDSLETRAAEYYRIYRSMFPRGPIVYENKTSVYDSYSEARRIIDVLEPIIREELTNLLSNRAYIEYILPERPLCNKFYNISVKITVYNPFDFPLKNIFLRIRTFYGNVSLFVPEIENTYVSYHRLFSIASVCTVHEEYIYGNQYVSIKRVVVNVSSPFELTCYPRNLYGCIFLSPGINVFLINLSSNVSTTHKVYNNKLYIELMNHGPALPVFEYIVPYSNITGANVDFTVLGNETRFIIFNFSSGSKVLVVANISGKREYLESLIHFYFNETNTSLADNLKYISLNEMSTYELEAFAEQLEKKYISQKEYERNLAELYRMYNTTESKLQKTKKMLGYDVAYAPLFFNAELMLEKFRRCVGERNLSCARDALECVVDIISNISFSKKDYSYIVDFVCDYYDCSSLRKQYERYLSGDVSTSEFERVLNSAIEEVRQDFFQKVSQKNLNTLLNELKLALGENSTQYSEFKKRVDDLMNSIQRAGDDLLNSSPRELLLRTELLVKEIKEVINTAKYRAKKLLLTARDMYERSVNKDKLTPYLKKAFDSYNTGKFYLSSEYSKRLMKLVEEGDGIPWVEIFITAAIIIFMLFVLKRPKKEEKPKELIPGS